MSQQLNPDQIDRAQLQPLVRRALGRPEFEIQEWEIHRLGGGAGNPVSAGLFRFTGRGRDSDGEREWSLVLKIIQSPANLGAVNMGEGDDQSHWNYWRRELLVYQSGLLELLPPGLRAPRFFGWRELPGNLVWLWLEDIQELPEIAWSLDDYARAAQAVGALNGSFANRQEVLSLPWLSRRRLGQWVYGTIRWRELPWEHPLVLERYGPPASSPFRRLLQDNRRVLDRLEALPQSLSHGDSYPTNFKFHNTPAGERVLVALDWALVGIAPLGDDLGQFVSGAQTILAGLPARMVEDRLFESYLNGLHESGCQADARQVRLAFCAGAALRVGLFQVYLLQEEIKQGRQPAGAWAGSQCFEAAMAEQAFELLEELGVG